MRNLHYDKRTKRWAVEKVVAGKRHRKSFASRDDATDHIRQLERGSVGLPSLVVRVSLSEAKRVYWKRLKTWGARPETYRYYTNKFEALAKVLGEKAQLHTLTQSDIAEYIRLRRQNKVSNGTIHDELAILHRATRRAGSTPQWAVPPLRVTRKMRPAPLPEEVARLWCQLRGASKVAVALTLLTGMRAEEAFRGKASDLKGDILKLPNRKEGDEHWVYVVPTLKALLPSHGKLVAGTKVGVRSALVRASKRAGVATWSGPGLGRHCFATWARLAGFSTQQAADGLGHSWPGVATPRYINIYVDPTRKAMAESAEKLLLEALASPQTPQNSLSTVSRK